MPSPAGGPAPGPVAPVADPAPAAPAPTSGEPAPPGPGDDTDTPSPQQRGSANGPDSEAATAGSYPGEASLRYQLIRHVERDAIGVQYNFLHSARSQVRPMPLPGDQVEAIRMAFAEPHGWADIRSAFAKRRVTILRGRAGAGKKGAAIRLFLSTLQGQIYQLDSRVQLSQLADAIAPDGEVPGSLGDSPGFLVDQPRDTAGLRVDVLQGLEPVLKQADARLVLTVGSEVILPDHDLRDCGYMLDLPGHPASREVVARHLAFRAGDERAEELIAQPGIEALIREHATAECHCSFAVALAGFIADRCADAGDAAAAVSKIADDIARHRAGRFESWFAGLPDAQTRAFAIALAVFGGLPYEAVARAARALYERFDSAPPYLVMSSDLWFPGRPPRLTKVRPTITTRRERLQILSAHIAESDAAGMHGTSWAELVEYDDSSYATEVLRYAWTAYEIQDILIGWLRGLADDVAVQIQLLTARALGLLATWSFDYVSARVLAPWAASKNKDQRQAVAYALWKAVSEEPRLLANARVLIKGWYANTSNPYVQATAARAYGLALGSFDLPAALEALGRLLIVDHPAVAVSIGYAMADLMAPATIDISAGPPASGDTDAVRRILGAFEASVSERDRSDAAELAFLAMASLLITPVPSGDTGEILPWPSLLHLTVRMPEVRQPVVNLWRHVLSDSPYPSIAESIMTQWAAIADADPAARTVFLRLARSICRSHARCQLIMDRFAAEWVSPKTLQPLHGVSADLRSVLAAESEVI